MSGWKLSTKELAGYVALQGWLAELHRDIPDENHRLLGHANTIQDDVTGKGERLLLQLSANEGAGMNWAGVVYFVIEDGPLKKKSFGDVRLEFQS